jgi:two-component system OmpR family sensor kinase
MRSLSVRVPVLAMAILALSLVSAGFIAYELLLVAGRRDLDAVLGRERTRFERSMLHVTREAGREATHIDATRIVRRAVVEYMALHPSTESYLIIVRMDGDVLSSPGGPEELVELRDRGKLPTSMPGEFETVDTPLGRIRSLSATIFIGGERVASFQVAGSLEPIRWEALGELRRLAVAGVLSLVLGGTLLTLVLRGALASLRRLAGAARSVQLTDLSIRVPKPKRAAEVAALAEEFNRMLDRLDLAVRSRQELFAAASHELRTPITIARGHVETLEAAARNDPAALTETVAIVREELVRMGRLVEDLMALARANTEDFVHLKAVRLPEFFDDLRLRLGGLEMGHVSFEPVPDIVIRADPDRLAQAVLNLVVNARLHNPPETRIEVGLAEEGDEVAVFVRDDGRGIHPSIRERAFEPFVRDPESNAEQSTGLGLAVVQVVAAAHGARVGLETGPAGTMVTLHLSRAEDARMERGPALTGLAQDVL